MNNVLSHKILSGLLLGLLLTVPVAGQNRLTGGVKGRVRVDGATTPGSVTVIARQGEREVKRVETKRKGEFEIQGLEPGLYGFTFRKPGLSTGRLENVEVRAGKTHALSDRLIMTVDEGTLAFIRGSVFDTGGRAIPGARVELALLRSDGTPKKLGESLSGEAGMFVFRLAPTPARYRLTIKADGMQTTAREVEVDGAARTNVAITLLPTAH